MASFARWMGCFKKDGQLRRCRIEYSGPDVEAAMFHVQSRFGRRALGVYTMDLPPPVPSSHEVGARIIDRKASQRFAAQR